MVMVVGLVLNNNNSNTESVSGFILLVSSSYSTITTAVSIV